MLGNKDCLIVTDQLTNIQGHIGSHGVIELCLSLPSKFYRKLRERSFEDKESSDSGRKLVLFRALGGKVNPSLRKN
jgi:hypothetical protein